MSTLPNATASAQAIGASPEVWAHWQGLGLTADLLAVVSDLTVPISAGSALKQLDGKTPTQIDSSGHAAGIAGWSQRTTTARDIDRWAKDGRHGIGLVGRQVKAFDIDIEDQAQAGAIRDFIELTMGALPCRSRANSGKCLLAFRLDGPLPKRRLATEGGMIELLGDRQQFLVNGQHKSGVRYEWEGGLPIQIPALTGEEVAAVWDALTQCFGAPGGASIDRAPLALASPRRRVDIDDPDVDRIEALGLVREFFADGKVGVQCPNEAEHGGDSGPSEAVYIPRGVGNQQQAGFKCLHAHCQHLDIFGFRRLVGLDVVTDDAWPMVVDADSGELEEIKSPKHSDDQLALVFATRAIACLRMTPGMGWMVNAQDHWQRDEHLQRFDLARGICRGAATLADKPHEGRALASSRTVNAVVTLAQSDRRLIVPASAWDADAFALNTPAGIVNLRTGAIRQRQAGDLVTRVTNAAPDFSAGCPHWLRFLDAVCAGDRDLIEFMRRMLGYMLTGDRREQKLFFIWGRGANGKTTLGELLQWVLGGYGMKLSSSVLMQSAHDRHPTELAQLKGARAAVSSELEEGQFFNESRVKELTGDDTLSARFMRGDFFEFAMTHKHLVIGNHKPRLKGGDPALARRLVLVPFRAAFSGAKVDPDMPAKLRAEGPAILAWMIGGAVAWAADGLALPAVVRDASDEYMADHNDVEQWLDECCERGAAHKERAGVLYGSFAQWKLARGERAPSAVTWAERMALLSDIQKRRSNGAVYAGLRLSPTAGADGGEFA